MHNRSIPKHSNMCDRIHQHTRFSVRLDNQKVGVPRLTWLVKEVGEPRSPAISLVFHEQWLKKAYFNRLER